MDFYTAYGRNVSIFDRMMYKMVILQQSLSNKNTDCIAAERSYADPMNGRRQGDYYKIDVKSPMEK